MKQHMRLGLSQQNLPARAGLRREKVSRVESKQDDPMSPDLPAAPVPQEPRRLVPQEFDKAAFIDGSKAKILNWGKVPRF